MKKWRTCVKEPVCWTVTHSTTASAPSVPVEAEEPEEEDGDAAEAEAEEDDDDLYDEFNPYLFIKQLPPYAEVVSHIKFMCIPSPPDIQPYCG